MCGGPDFDREEHLDECLTALFLAWYKYVKEEESEKGIKLKREVIDLFLAEMGNRLTDKDMQEKLQEEYKEE